MTINNPLVSVLIPTYNNAKFIKQAIDSVYAQNYENIEIIVVDDGSTDNTKEILKEYKDIKYFYIEHKGIPFARNFSIDKSNGEYIAFLDSDDYWVKGKLNTQVKYLNEHQDCSIVFTKLMNFFDSELIKNSIKAIKEKEVENIIKYYIPSALIKKELFIKYGKFDENFKTSEDTDLIFRLKKNGVNIDNFIDEVFYMRRLHGKNVTLVNSFKNKAKNLANILRKGMIKK